MAELPQRSVTNEQVEADVKEEPIVTKTAPSSTSGALHRQRQRRRGLIQFFAACFSLFAVGWGDGASGPLLPRIQAEYDVDYTIVSLIFILNTVGCIISSVSNVYLTQKLGFGKVVVIGAVSQIISFVIASTAPPFPVFVFSFLFAGFGMALQDCQGNGYTAALKENAATKMGILHAVYGLGALVSPAISTQFSKIPRWSFFYLTSAGVGLINLALLTTVFRFRTQEDCLQEIGQEPLERSDSEENHYKQILRIKIVYLLAIYLFCYVGAEVTMGSWTVTYITQVRGGGSSSGYVSTGFFGGLTFGRIALLWLNKRIGEERVVFIYILIAIGLQLIVWLVPSLIIGAICVSLIGMVMGPMFPIAVNHAGRVLPPWLLTSSIGLMAGLAATGAAAIPFMTGAIASSAGIKTMQPLMVGMLGILLCLWGLVQKSGVWRR